MNLVIVESGAKARKIATDLNASAALAHLGKFNVIACFGHIRDLSKKNLGINISNNSFQPIYEIIYDKQKTLRNLKDAHTKSKHVWIASDPDIEGEAIAASLFECLNLADTEYSRVTFNEINKQSLTHAFLHPRKIDWNKVHAQLARRMVDRLVGFKLSPLLWKQFPYATYGALSAGRVQSACLQMCIDLETKIQSHVSTPHFIASAHLLIDQHQHIASFYSNNTIHKWSSEEDATSWLTKLSTDDWKIADVISTVEKEHPHPPYITSTLQQDCHIRFKFTSDKTMKLAQSLYEAGFITYMRTDSTHMAEPFVKECQSFVLSTFGETYVGDKVASKKSSANAQEAHECIRITHCACDALPDVKDWTKDHKQLYHAIYLRTIAAVMSPALYNVHKTIIKHPSCITPDSYWQTNLKTCAFDGWKRLMGGGGVQQDEEVTVPDDKVILPTEASVVSCEKCVVKGSWSQPPSRFNEASIIKALEKEGIGRPSTYATILNKLREKQYVTTSTIVGQKKDTCQLTWTHHAKARVTKKQIQVMVGSDKHCMIPTEIGKMVNSFLSQRFQMILDVQFTSSLETKLDLVEDGTVSQHDMLQSFYVDFDNCCKQQSEAMNVGSTASGQQQTELCGSSLQVTTKVTKHGHMLKKGDRIAFVPLSTNVKDMTEEEINAHFVFPRSLGEYDGHDISVCKGPYGYYISSKQSKQNVTLPSNLDPATCSLEDAGGVLMEHVAKKQNNIVREWSTIGIYNGPYGYYIKQNKTNVGVPKQVTLEQLQSLTIQQCRELFAKCMEQKQRKTSK
jgi:DNA topoisomerase-1